jgi:hypothetical protein
VLEFPASIIGFCGLGEHFDKHSRIQEGIVLVVCEMRCATDHQNIGVCVEPSGADSQAQIVCIRLTGTAFKLSNKQIHQVGHDGRMPFTGPCHGEDLTGIIFTFILRSTFLGKILLDGQKGLTL